MRSRSIFWVVLGLLVLAGVWFFWPSGSRPSAQKNKPATPSYASVRSASTAPVLFAGKTATNAVTATTRTNRFAWRVSNTPDTIGQLMNNPHAILLDNAFIDTRLPLNLNIPKNLQSTGDPGAYIVQARGPVGNAFRATLAAAGAQIVSYIPNNAYLVKISSGGAAGLAGQPPVQSVIPYEPYYKISGELIGAAVQQKDLPDNSTLTLGLFADDPQATIDEIKRLGGTPVGKLGRSPFGPVIHVIPPKNWTALAALAPVGIMELTHQRKAANDLARVTMGISADTITPTNYLGLTGNGVLVEVNDTGVDANHPDFSATGTAKTGPAGTTRVIGLSSSLVDVNGHGTHVAGIIAGNGSKSYSIANTPQGSVTNADFRGKAPLANVYSFAAFDSAGNSDISDYDLQAVPATNNALISNNSWNYDDSTYNLAAASYDAAVRDALPLLTGSQPVLFVFAAGNDGGGSDNGGGGDPDTILSPGTAKDVITVGALEQLRFITNSITNIDGMVTTPWQDGTDSASDVAGYSARGNVGIGTEGTSGRFKPDLVAPGSFVVSTRSAQWDQVAYYNPTNYSFNGFNGQLVEPGSLAYYSITIPANAVGVAIYIVPNSKSPVPFPLNMPIYVSKNGFPTTTVNDFMTANNQVVIPPDGGGAYIPNIQNGGLNFAVGDSTNFPVNYDVITEITTTNEMGNYFEVLSNLNETLAPYYRYESGTSMAAPAVSGALALVQDYFTNILHATTAPSPALLKALVINGARSQPSYKFAVTNLINLQGWGLPIVSNTLPSGLTNISAPCTSFFLDQSPTNALATGDSQTFIVDLDPDNFIAQTVPLRVTLAWTDPPGNPAAAIKLVNSLELVVTNLDTGDANYQSVYFGNDLDGGSPSYSAAWVTNTMPNIDQVNNVQNVFLSALTSPLGLKYSVTVIGRSVNVNAVTAQTNNVVQDYALVISSGDGEVTNAITVTPVAPNPFVGPIVTYVSNTNTLLMNQIAGGNTPLLGTNTVGAGAGYVTNAAITVGMTNQWHFYVVTNRLGFTNAAFITFLSQTLATPRMGVFANEDQNPTQPEADIDLYVACIDTDPQAFTLTNLNPVILSNCVHGLNGDAASLGNGTGTEYVAYSNATPNSVYFIGVKSETQVAAEYDFLPVFSLYPFSQQDANGNETVNGLLVPVNIPDGSPAHPGVNYVIALAIQPVSIQNVTVTNDFQSQNFGDLVGVLNHSGKNVVLNNHNSPPPTVFPDLYDFVYDQSPQPLAGSQPPDGPGSLISFQGQEGTGPWILTETDNSLTQTSSVTGLTIFIQPHLDLTGNGQTISLAGQSYFYGYVDVPAGATNLTIAGTNTTLLPPGPDTAFPGQIYEKLGEQPVPPPTPLTNYDKLAILNQTGPLGPGGVITIGPSDLPPIQPGRYYVTLYNPSPTAQTYFIIAKIALGQVPQINFGASGPTNLLDDAVMYSSVFVTNTLPIATIGVGLRVDHPRISDLVFHLISPDGTRYLLMENRGALSTNGCGVTIVNSNDFPPVSFSGGPDPVTNIINVGQTFGTVAIDYNFFTLPDEMSIFYQGAKIFDSTLISGSGTFQVPYGPGTSSNLTIVMNEFTNSMPTTEWNYIIHSTQTNFYYLTLTDDTNLTTTPIKFAPPPFVPSGVSSTVAMQDAFDSSVGGEYPAPGFIPNTGWQVTDGNVDILNAGNTLPEFLADSPPNCLDLSGSTAGTIVTNFNTIPGQQYNLSFAYTKNASPADPGYPYFIASAQISITGLAPFILSTDPTFTNSYYSLNWMHTNFVFTASGLITTLEFKSLNAGDGGMFLDTISVKSLAGGLGGLYYQPEQSLDALVGTSPYGLWQLEIQDDRVGATNHTVLDSWQLQFIFAQTNPVPADINGGSTNFIPAGGLAWYEVDVPTNADFATNILIFATGPLNMWYSTNVPPTIVNPGDVQFLSGSTVGSETLGTNGSPVNTTSAYIVPSGTYYIGIQNPGAFTVQYGVRVDFHLLGIGGLGPYAFTEPATLVTGASAQLNGMATPNGFPANAWFQWGSSQNYGAVTTPVPVGTGSNVVFVPTLISGLMTNFPIHYRLVVSNAVGIAYGFDQILDQGNLVAWGADFKGQTTPIPPGLTNLVAGVGAGYDYSLALNYNGTVVAWGNNSQGQTNVPAGLTNAVAVDGGVVDSLALRSDRTVTVWGSNLYGQTNVPPDLTNAIAAASGSYHCLALRVDGNPVAWGTDTSFQTNVPVSLSNVVAVSAGEFHSLALKNDGTVVAWGNNAEGETNVPPDLTNVVAISAGYSHNLALKNDGTVVAWGFNGNGQTNVPSGLTNVMAIAAGGYHCLALKTDGTVVFWGDSGAGQTNFYPVNLTNVFTIAGGGFHTLAVSSLYGLNVTNTPPYWTNGLDSTTITMPELTTKVINNSALDSNAPPQLVFYSFATNPPPFASIDAFTGLITLSPQAGDGPSTNIISTVATDNGYPPLSATNSFTLIVTSTNSTPSQTNTIPISGIVHTNIGGINGFLLTWFAPSNDLFMVQWSDGLPFTWQTFTNIISYDTNYPASSTNATFTYFDDGSQAPFTGSRYYQLILLGSGSGNTPPALPPQVTQTINPLNSFVVTNTATDAQSPPQILTYTLTSTVTGLNVPVISPTGIITWTPDVSQAGTSNLITTVVTDNGSPSLSATNSFSVIVNPVPGIGSIIHTTIGGTNGYLLTWYAPSNDLFQVQWSDGLPFTWQTFTNIISYDTNYPASSTNATFTYFDDGSQAPFTGSRYYQLILLGSGSGNMPPLPPPQATQTINPLNPLVVTNTATDADIPAQTLTYTLTSTVTGPNIPLISPTGIITWTPDVTQAGTSNLFATVVTDSGSPNLSATNSFAVIVNPVPGIGSVIRTNVGGTNGFLLTWYAPTNDIFQVQVATNLASPWLTIATNVIYTGSVTPTNGLFTYYDDGSQVPFGSLRFYRLQLVGITPPAPTTVPIGSITFSSGSFVLTWTAPTNNQFNVRWATNLVPPVVWTSFTNIITSTTGTFTFTDTNTTMLMKFYDLLLLP